GGSLVDNVNRWRGQIGLPPAAADEINRLLKPIEVDGERGQLIDLTGRRIVGVMCTNGGQTWFFKMTGSPAAIAKHRASFDELLSSTRFPATDARPELTAPAGWREIEHRPEQLALYRTGADDDPVEVSVTGFPGAAGGAVANVNRWRGQLGLSPATSDEVLRSIQ